MFSKKLQIRCGHSCRRALVLDHSGMARFFQPLPLIRAGRDGADSTSDRRSPFASETRAPVLYIRANRTWSR